MFERISSCCTASSKEARTNALWDLIKGLYQNTQSTTKGLEANLGRLRNVTGGELPPQLHAKAAHVKGIPKGLWLLLHQLALCRLPGEGTQLSHKCAARYLAQLEENGRLLKWQWMALEQKAQAQEEDANFHGKIQQAKWHHPKSSWCYQDETLGHPLQQERNPSRHAKKVLLPWAQNESPRFFKTSA